MSDQSTAEIETGLKRERLALQETLAPLKNRINPSTVASEGKSALLGQAAPALAAIERVLRARPVTSAVLAVATAALVFGRRAELPPSNATPTLAGTRHEAMARWEDEGGQVRSEELAVEEDWLDDAMALHGRANEILARISDASRRRLAPIAELAAFRSATLRALARDTATVLGRGLETMTEPARDLALRQRERFYLGRVNVTAATRHVVDHHPLATGLALAASGAALACLFPQTEAEDRLLGPARDRVVADARAALRREVLSASAVAQTVAEAFDSDLNKVGSIFPRKPG
jgi:hypothetical protein